MSWLDAILAVELGVLSTMATLWLIAVLADWATRRFGPPPPPPYCGIDPRCHPAYYRGWIGSVRVSER